MPDPLILFDDGAAYEAFMGVWSRIAGDAFLLWLAPPSGARWVDIGCGNGAFTALLIERCAPAAVQGIDPSAAQVAFARERLSSPTVAFDIGDATALPYPDRAFDAAVMALVIFFVPDPARAVAEMARAVRPGGSVSAYAWDILGSGFPYAVMEEELTALGAASIWPPSVEASRIDAMRGLWIDAGLTNVETHRFSVQRTFTDFESYWRISQTGPRIGPRVAALTTGELATLRERVRRRLAAGPDGRITCGAWVNAVRGVVARGQGTRAADARLEPG